MEKIYYFIIDCILIPIGDIYVLLTCMHHFLVHVDEDVRVYYITTCDRRKKHHVDAFS